MINLSEYQLSELAKCYNDPIYFIENYCWIELKEQAKIIPAHLFEYQREILTWLVEGKSGLVLKSRRVGASTVVALYLAWLINFRRGVNALLISRKETEAIKLLDKVKFSFYNVRKRDTDDFAMAEDASWMLNPVAVRNQQLFATGWYDDDGNLLSKSEIASLTTTSDTGRGDSATFIFLDEMAFIDDQEGISRSARLTTTRGGYWLAVSTPNGVGDKFYEWCMRAERGENKTYNFRRVHWSEAEMTQEMIDNATEGFDEASVLQEMEMEFISSGDPVFSHTHLSACYRPLEDYPNIEQEILDYKLSVNKNIDDIEKRYKSDHKVYNDLNVYYSGVDTAIGKLSKKDSKRDYHSFTALSKSGIQCYAFHSKEHSLTEWAGNVEQIGGKAILHKGVVSKLHKEFPGIMNVEINGPGHAVYLNHNPPEDGVSDVFSKHTNSKTKEQLIRQLIIAVESTAIVITDKFTYQCMLVYQRGSTPGSYQAPNGSYDDPVMSLALAWDALLKQGAIEFNWGKNATEVEMPEKTNEGIESINLRNSGYGPAFIINQNSNVRLSDVNPNDYNVIMSDDLDLSRIKEPVDVI